MIRIRSQRQIHGGNWAAHWNMVSTFVIAVLLSLHLTQLEVFASPSRVVGTAPGGTVRKSLECAVRQNVNNLLHYFRSGQDVLQPLSNFTQYSQNSIHSHQLEHSSVPRATAYAMLPSMLFDLEDNTSNCEIQLLLETLGVGVGLRRELSRTSANLLLAYEAAVCDEDTECQLRRQNVPTPAQTIARRHAALYLLSRFSTCLFGLKNAANTKVMWGLPMSWPMLANFFLVAPWDTSMISAILKAGHPPVQFVTPAHTHGVPARRSSLALLMTSANEQDTYSLRRGMLMAAHAIVTGMVQNCRDAFYAFTAVPGRGHEIFVDVAQLNATTRVETFASMIYRIKYQEFSKLPSFRSACRAMIMERHGDPTRVFVARQTVRKIFDERAEHHVRVLMNSRAAPLTELGILAPDGSTILHELARQGFAATVATLAHSLASRVADKSLTARIRCEIVRTVRVAMLHGENFNARTPLHLAARLHGNTSRVFQELQSLARIFFDAIDAHSISPRCKLHQMAASAVWSKIQDRFNRTVVEDVIALQVETVAFSWQKKEPAKGAYNTPTIDKAVDGLSSDAATSGSCSTSYAEPLADGGWRQFGRRFDLELAPPERCDIKQVRGFPETNALADLLAEGRPVLFRGALDLESSAPPSSSSLVNISAWSVKTFLSLFGSETLRVETVPFEAFMKADGVQSHQHMKVTDYVKIFNQSSTAPPSGATVGADPLMERAGREFLNEPMYSFNGIDPGSVFDVRVHSMLQSFVDRVKQLPGMRLSSAKSVRSLLAQACRFLCVCVCAQCSFTMYVWRSLCLNVWVFALNAREGCSFTLVPRPAAPTCTTTGVQLICNSLGGNGGP